MLPRFTKIEKLLEERFARLLFQISHSGDPVFGEIKSSIIHEGKATYHKEGSRERATNMKTASGVAEVKKSEMKTFGLKEFVEVAKKIGGEFLKQKNKTFLSVMTEATEETGNIVDGQGKPLSHEFILQGLEKIYLDFDEDGNPQLPTIVIAPAMAPRMQQLIAEQDSPEVKKRFEEVIEKKREEFRAREAARRLDG